MLALADFHGGALGSCGCSLGRACAPPFHGGIGPGFPCVLLGGVRSGVRPGLVPSSGSTKAALPLMVPGRGRGCARVGGAPIGGPGEVLLFLAPLQTRPLLVAAPVALLACILPVNMGPSVPRLLIMCLGDPFTTSSPYLSGGCLALAGEAPELLALLPIRASFG